MKKVIQNFILVSVSILLILILMELFLFFNHYSPDYKRFKMELNGVNLTFNDNPDVYFKDKNINKSIYLGDSFTVGEVCAHNQKDFVGLIKQDGEKKLNNSVYNFGSLGISPTDMVNIYNHIKVGSFKKITIVLYYNDIFLSKQGCKNVLKFDKYGIPYVQKCDKILSGGEDTSNNTTLKKVDNILEVRIKTWRLLKEALVNSPFFSKVFNRSEWKYLYQNKNSDEFKLFINTLDYFKKESELNNFEINFIYFPDVNNINKSNPLHGDWKNFINEAKLKNIIIHDPWNFFLKNASRDNLAWSLTDDHPNCEAHKIMYEYISKNLL